MVGFATGFVVFDGITQLDFTGPFEVLSRIGTPPSLDTSSRFADASTHVVAKALRPVQSDKGLGILPTCTFADCPPLDMICIPGGPGVIDAISDGETVGFVQAQAGQASYVTSVCMGAFVLGAAGLLRGRRATTHWAYVDLLPLVGARHEPARVVRDGNLFTAGGVSAGIDFGFTIVAEVAGAEVAKAIQLGIEYDPRPPFDAGRPETSSDSTRKLMEHRNETARASLRRVLAALRPAMP